MIRHRVLGFMAIVLATLPARAQQASQVQDAATKVLQLARQVAADPNNGGLHERLAEAYVMRGAAGDALRSLRHARRATSLNPHVPVADRQPAVGVRNEPLTAEMDEADMQADATIPPEEEQRVQDLNEKLRSDLSQRIGRSCTGAPSSQYAPNLKDMQVIFSPENDAAGPNAWSQRQTELQHAVRSGLGGAGRVAQAFEDFLRRDVARRTEAEANQNKTDPNFVPDYFLLKERALLEYRAGDITAAVADLQATAAAITTHLTRQMELPRETPRRQSDAKLADRTQDVPLPAPQRQNSVPEDVAPSVAAPTPPEQLRVTPPRELSPATPAREQPRETPGQVQTPPRELPPDAPPVMTTVPVDRSQPPGTPPRMETVTQRIGTEVLETSEAVRSTRIPPAEVGDRLETLAAVGTQDPLVLDLNGNGQPDLEGELIGEPGSVARTVLFDLLGSGNPQQVEWMKPGADGLLAVDRDGNGAIDSGKELVGHHPGYPCAAAELSLYDINRDGVLTGAELTAFRIWRDDGDGKCRGTELYHLFELGVSTVRLPRAGSRAVDFQRGEGVYRAWDWFPSTR